MLYVNATIIIFSYSCFPVQKNEIKKIITVQQIIVIRNHCCLFDPHKSFAEEQTRSTLLLCLLMPYTLSLLKTVLFVLELV